MARVGQIEPLEIVWRPYELRPEGAPPPPAEYIERAWQQSVGPLSRQLGVTMNKPSTNPSTRLTHEAVAYAVHADKADGETGNEAGPGNADPFIMAVFRAYWEDDRDISDIEVLCDLAENVGLDAAGMRAALQTREFAPYVDEQIQAARTTYQVSAVPTLIIADKYRIRGLPMEEQLLETIREAKGEFE